MRNYRFNVYGFWVFMDTIGLSGGIERYDVVYVYSKKGDMVSSYTTTGEVVEFHVTNLTKKYFVRPGIGHDPAKCPDKKFYSVPGRLLCPGCDIFKSKMKLKKILKRKSVK